jgi:hypothetical protein
MKIGVEMNSIPVFYLIFLYFNFFCNTLIFGDFLLCFLERLCSSLGPEVGILTFFSGTTSIC